MIRLDEASDPAKEFGALSFFIFLRIGRLSGGEFGKFALGAQERAYRFRPPFGVSGVAARQRLVRVVQKPPQRRAILHFRLTRLNLKSRQCPKPKPKPDRSDSFFQNRVESVHCIDKRMDTRGLYPRFPGQNSAIPLRQTTLRRPFFA